MKLSPITVRSTFQKRVGDFLKSTRHLFKIQIRQLNAEEGIFTDQVIIKPNLAIFQIYVLSNTSSPVDAPIPLLHSKKAGKSFKIEIKTKVKYL